MLFRKSLNVSSSFKSIVLDRYRPTFTIILYKGDYIRLYKALVKPHLDCCKHAGRAIFKQGCKQAI